MVLVLVGVTCVCTLAFSVVSFLLLRGRSAAHSSVRELAALRSALASNRLAEQEMVQLYEVRLAQLTQLVVDGQEGGTGGDNARSGVANSPSMRVEVDLKETVVVQTRDGALGEDCDTLCRVNAELDRLHWFSPHPPAAAATVAAGAPSERGRAAASASHHDPVLMSRSECDAVARAVASHLHALWVQRLVWLAGPTLELFASDYGSASSSSVRGSEPSVSVGNSKDDASGGRESAAVPARAVLVVCDMYLGAWQASLPGVTAALVAALPQQATRASVSSTAGRNVAFAGEWTLEDGVSRPFVGCILLACGHQHRLLCWTGCDSYPRSGWCVKVLCGCVMCVIVCCVHSLL